MHGNDSAPGLNHAPASLWNWPATSPFPTVAGLLGSGVAPLKLVGLLFLRLRGFQGFMTVKSADEYRAQARGVRALAETMISPEERQTLLEIAESYERLAQQTDQPKTNGLCLISAGNFLPPSHVVPE